MRFRRLAAVWFCRMGLAPSTTAVLPPAFGALAASGAAASSYILADDPVCGRVQRWYSDRLVSQLDPVSSAYRRVYFAPHYRPRHITTLPLVSYMV